MGVSWALARFATVGEVKTGNKRGANSVTGTASVWRSEIAISLCVFTTRKEEALSLKWKKCVPDVYDNPTRVMTNGPGIPSHLTNSNNYTY
ncbi:linear amide C-N hydrolase [Salmonella enterica subsp. enterica]|nr:linear amide C-N hydrolase [Salmonella enterica subsp. enterica]